MSDGETILYGGRKARSVRVEVTQEKGEYTAQDAFAIPRPSQRWLQVFTDSGSLTVSGGAAPDYESTTIEIWPYDEVLVEFELDTSADLDLGIRFRDLDDAANINVVNVRDPDTAAVLDVTAVFQETARNASAATTYIWYCLDHNFPAKWKIRLYVENDDGVNAGAYTVSVYGRILK